jgi:SAM-dependent methyltransferase
MPFPENQFDVVMGSFMIFHMSEATRRTGISEIQRVLKPVGILLIVDISLPDEPDAKALARRALGGMDAPDMRDLIPVLSSSGFSDVEFGPVDFEIAGISVIGYVRGRARKN